MKRRTLKFLACLLFAAAVFPVSAIAEDQGAIPGLPGEGQGRYVMVLWENGTPGPDGTPVRDIAEPDLAAVGGSLLGKEGAQRIIDLPLESAAELRQHRSVKYLQRVWMGEPPEEINEPRLSAVGKRRGIETEDGPETWELGYEYDGSGNIKKIGPDDYVYDTAGRLIQATVGGKTEKYKYDPFGNLTELAVDGAPPMKVPVDASNRLVGLSYDPAGNVLSSQETVYRYDSLNMLIYADSPVGTPRHYLYDVNDELLGTLMTSAGSSRWTMRDFEGRVLREYTADPIIWSSPWVWKQDFIYGEGEVVGGESPQIQALENPGVIYGGARHYHLDHLQSVRMVTDSQGRSTARHAYYPFGIGATVTNQEAAFLSDFQIDEQRFAGHQRDYLGAIDLENRDYLDYMHARHYNPNIGRFLSVDPGRDWDISKPQSWNMYTYVRNNPINAMDPTGMCGEGPDFVGPTEPCGGTLYASIQVVASSVSDQEHYLWLESETTMNDASFAGDWSTLSHDSGYLWTMYQEKQKERQVEGPEILNGVIIMGSLRGTAPTLPARTLAAEGEVTIKHNFRSNDHPPAHAHVEGGGPSTRIGPNGKPILNDPPMTAAQRAVYDANKSFVRRAINKIGRWLDYNGW